MSSDLKKKINIICKLPSGCESLNIREWASAVSISKPYMPPHFLLDIYQGFLLGLKLLIKEKPDLMIVNNTYEMGLIPWLVTKFFNIPLCAYYMSDLIDNESFIMDRLLFKTANFIAKRVLKDAKVVRVSSQGIADKLIELGLDKKKIKIIPVDIAGEFESHFTTCNEQILNETNKNRVLFIGDLDGSNDFELYCKSIKILIDKYPDMIFDFVGDSFSVCDIRALSKKYEITKNLRFKGWINGDELISTVKMATLIAVPAQYLTETVSKSMLLAAIHKIPVVSLNICGVTDFIDNSISGFIVYEKDAVKFAENMLILIENGSVRKRMGNENYEKNKYLLSKNYYEDKYRSLYDFAYSN